MKITKFDRSNLELLKAAIDKALDPIAKEFGLGSLKVAAGSFSPTDWTGKVTATLTPDLIASNPEIIAKNKMFIELLGLPENVMDMVFTAHGKTFTVIGFNPRKPKNAISLEETNGKKLMCPVETITNLITLKKYKLKSGEPKGSKNGNVAHFKDEGHFQTLKLTVDGKLPEDHKMYEFGSLEEKTFATKREAKEFATANGWEAEFE